MFNNSSVSKILVSWKKISYLFLFFTGIIYMLLNCNCSNESNHEGDRVPHIPKILFISPATRQASAEEAKDAESLKNSLFISGIRVSEIPTDKLKSGIPAGFDAIVIPCASAKELDKPATLDILKAIQDGTNLVTDGVNPLTALLEIQLLSTTVKVSTIHDLQFPNNLLYWSQPANVQPIELKNHSYVPLCVVDSSQITIAIHGKHGKGKFIYYATLFDPITDKGYSRFPYLIETISSVFGIRQLASRRASEMFYDDAMKNDSISYDKLASQWRERKIKRIYASGWYLEDTIKYDQLIKACHANGIIVCCWLETPMISKEFWDQHPQWREQTAYLKDANIDWRFLMNLADSNCYKAVCNEFEKLLMRHDWDGVNLAELYFEPSPVGPENPPNFTPMNQLVRKEFKIRGGFDPVLLFDTKSPHYWETDKQGWRKFADYRKELCMRLKTKMLDYLSGVKSRKKDFELMLTVIDVSLTPELSDNIAEDTKNALSLYATYPLTLQVEDPSNCWGSTPDRYDKMGRFYRQYVKKKNELVFDCNVVASHEKGYGGFPSEKPTGEEIRQITYNMNLSNSRPTFYSEDAIFLNDFLNISTVLGRDTKLTEVNNHIWKVVSPHSIILSTGWNNNGICLDGKPWFACDKGEIIIPAGEHYLTFSKERVNPRVGHILLISGELISAKFSTHTTNLSYSEDVAPCYVMVDKKPSRILIDNVNSKPALYTSEPIRYTLKLPMGNHDVKIEY